MNIAFFVRLIGLVFATSAPFIMPHDAFLAFFCFGSAMSLIYLSEKIEKKD